MLIKEYRIALPMSLGEYQVAQLYMIQKKSREESSGEGSGVEILENRPYSDGPGGCGQFTHKVYHVGSHIPSWFRALLPKAALQVEEESWNAYPYTRTRYTCPFVEKFSIDIETYYKPDCGDQSNVFNLLSAEKRQRIVDMIDIVRDPIPQTEYKPDEDPKMYRSVKTTRGPLSESWIEERRAQEGQALVMCAYKLCKVEFRYWGMQSKIEQFIHDIGLRRVMLRAHRQAWCWQDEWCDLTMGDIRALEEETARTLAQRMGKFSEELGGDPGARGGGQGPMGTEGPRLLGESIDGKDLGEDGLPKQWSLSSRSSHSSQHAGAVTQQSLSEWRMQNIARDSENSSEDEFFDAHEDLSDSDEVFSKEITKWSSNDFIDKAGLVGEIEDRHGDTLPGLQSSGSRPPPCSMDCRSLSESVSSENISQSCKIHVLTLILHGGNILDPGAGDPGSKRSDLSTLSSVFDTVTRVHFPEALGHMVSRLVPCPSICSDALDLIFKLSPYGYDDDGLSSSKDQIPLAALPLLGTSSAQYREIVAGVITRTNQAYSEFLKSEEGINFKGQVCIIGDCVGGILGFDALCNNTTLGSPASSRRGSMNTERLSPEILIDTDPLNNVRLEGTRQLSKSNNELSMGTSVESQRGGPRKHSNSSTSDIDSMKQHHTFLSTLQANVLKGEGSLRRSSSSSMINLDGNERFDFEVSDLFLFGCPLGLVLALRKMVAPGLDLSQFRPACQQIYNLFHPADPSACRLEPLLTRDFHLIPPFSIPRYQKYPLGDGNSSLLVDTLQSFTSIFSGVPEPTSTTTLTPALGDLWKPSEHHVSSEGAVPQPGSPIPCDVARVVDKWWGSKRIDYALYCPDALTAFPTVTLPHLFHASYWESTDVVAFILRQVMRQQNVELEQVGLETSDFCPPLSREKWLRKRTQVKIRNVAANHRASDVVAVVGASQVLTGRFAYGPLDVVTLTGEKVDVYIMTQPPSGKWIQCGTETTNSSGRISCSLPQDKRLPLGMYPVRMFVRGDQTYAECYLSVLPKDTECVVFSIDGSFAASVSIMGSDPKVRAGAVDVVRHWQDRGYLIIYVTGRPDMQKQKVVAWLSQHNFPHGIVSFCDGLVHDPLRQKTAFLQSLVQEAEMKIEAAYGSTKDISVYGLLRIPAQHTYIVGRPSKKWVNQCQFLTEGYVTHLAQLEGRRTIAAAPTNARVALAKGSFRGTGRGHFPRQPTLLPHASASGPRGSGPSPPSRCRSERGGSGRVSERGQKPRSISLRFDSDP